MYLAESQKDLGRPEFGSHNWRWSLRLADARARLELTRGDPEKASKSIASLLEQANQTEARKYTVRGLALRGEMFLVKSSLKDSEVNLKAALDLADRICYPPARVGTRLSLDRLYRQSGNENMAEWHLAEASRLIAALDEQIQRPELRRSFERGLRKEVG